MSVTENITTPGQSTNINYYTVAGCLATLIWSASVAVAGYLTQTIGALTSASIEFFLGGFLLLLFSMFRGTFPSMFTHPPKYYLLCGGGWIANMSLYWLAFEYVSAPEELLVLSLINYLWPALTLLGSVVILKYRSRLSLIPGLLLAVSGAFLAKFAISEATVQEIIISFRSDSNSKAYLLTFLCAFAWAIYSNCSRKYSEPDAASAVPLFMFLCAGPMLIAGYLHGDPVNFGPGSIILLIVWAISNALAVIFWDLGMRAGNVIILSSVSMAIPLLSNLMLILVNNLPWNALSILAALLVVSGSYLCQRSVYEK